jgi:hypothetical protein
MWHLADTTTAFGDVRFPGQTGHSEVRHPCPLMTQSGHAIARRNRRTEAAAFGQTSKLVRYGTCELRQGNLEVTV